MKEVHNDVPAVVGHNSGDRQPETIDHEVLGHVTLLPWEDQTEYREILSALVQEHRPKGPTETHLVEELAGVIWRKRRLRLAECAAHRSGLEDAIGSHRRPVKVALAHLGAIDQVDQPINAFRNTLAETAEELRELEEDQAMTQDALRILEAGGETACEEALDALSDDTRDWWYQEIDPDVNEFSDRDPYTIDAAGLRRFLANEVLSWFETHRLELQNRPLIRSQLLGEAFDPVQLDKLIRYEALLDRKFERTVAMLVRLKELHRDP